MLELHQGERGWETVVLPAVDIPIETPLSHPLLGAWQSAVLQFGAQDCYTCLIVPLWRARGSGSQKMILP